MANDCYLIFSDIVFQCITFSLISLHFKIERMSVSPRYDSKARECSRDKARYNSNLSPTKERQLNIQSEICIINPPTSPAYTVEISASKINRIRAALGYTAPTTSPQTPSKPTLLRMATSLPAHQLDSQKPT